MRMSARYKTLFFPANSKANSVHMHTPLTISNPQVLLMAGLSNLSLVHSDLDAVQVSVCMRHSNLQSQTLEPLGLGRGAVPRRAAARGLRAMLLHAPVCCCAGREHVGLRS
jgi:hypothetical protein